MFTVNSDTSITVTVPSNASLGPPPTVDVKVTTNNGTSSAVTADQFVYQSAAAPAVTSLSPTSGSTAGGTSVGITGTNFTSATAVTFGGVAAASFTVNSATSITATSPPLSAGVIDVQVTTPSGPSALGSSDHFTYTAASLPTVTSLGTTTGTTAGGTSVSITGTNFTGATGVAFGSVPAASFTVNSSTSITATSPSDYAGTWDVTVSTYAGTSAVNSGDQFAYTLAATPAITSLGTSTGTTAGGTSVAITGTNFTAATGVSFGNVPAASFTVNSSTSITAIAPPQAAGTVDILVFTTAGSSAEVSGDHFTYSNASAPTVTSLGTTTGTTGGGTAVTINGTNFTGATAVYFGSIAAAFTVVSSTDISAIAPPQAAGTVDVTVTTFAATSSTSSSDHYVYTNASTPSVTGVTVSSGSAAGGTTVTVTGSAFTGATGVSFGSAAAESFTVLSDTILLATAPPGSAGTVDITVTTFAGTSSTGSSDHFTYSSVSAPTVTALSPSTGGSGGGTVVTVTGTGFLGATGVNFGSTPAASFAILSDTSLIATAPPLPAGVLDISVTDYGGTSALNSSDRYTITAAAAPAVTSLTGTSGTTAGGTTVTVNGSGFTAADVLFGGIEAESFTVNSDTSITAVAPSQAAGIVDVTVDTPSGSSAVSSSDEFTYSNASSPSVTGLSQTGGSTAGGTVVTVTGSYFTGATAVNFGTVAADFSVLADGYLIATAPSQAVGTVDVTVVTPSGTSSTSSADHFTYTAASAPSVSAVTPNTDTVAGGATVTVFGSHFTGATAVNFGSTAAASFTVLSDTSLTAVDPSETAGTIDVTVVTPSGTSSTSSADHFTYTAGSSPTVTGISPTSGSTAGGTIVTITGTNFTGVTEVDFGSYAAEFFVNSSTQLTAVAPAEAAATIDVTVTTGIGTSATSSSDHFTYNAASSPAVTGVSPNSGYLAGGTTLVITGTNLAGATAVYFGTVAATSFTFNADGTISAVSPAVSAGTVDITVTTFVGTSSTSSSDHFTYLTPPTLTPDSSSTVTPTHGVSYSGTLGGFTDSDTGGATSQFTAVINWGNGQFSAGTLVANGYDGSGHPKFQVQGSGALYATAGTYTITILVIGPGGSTTTLTATATVALADPTTDAADDGNRTTVPDDPTGTSEQAQVLVRLEHSQANDDPLTMQSADYVIDADTDDLDMIASGPLDPFGDLWKGPQQPQQGTQNVVIGVITTDTTGQAVTCYTTRQDTLHLQPTEDAVGNGRRERAAAWREELGTKEALFIALAENAERGEPGYEHAVLDSQEDGVSAASIWEDLTMAVRSVFDDLTSAL